jgi:hypothetical protein
MPAKSRASAAWKAFSVQAIAVLASQPVWYPIIDATARAALGEHAQPILTLTIGLLGVLGWIKPQASIPAAQK